MEPEPRDKCLILACGNPLRGDDGAAWHLAELLSETTLSGQIRVIVQQQWTPELAEDIVNAASVLFVDCSLDAAPGSVSLSPVTPALTLPNFLTHHQEPAALLALTLSLYLRIPADCDLLVIGAATVEHTEQLSPAVEAALPKALKLLLGWVERHGA